jgi:hypothetical protein
LHCALLHRPELPPGPVNGELGAVCMSDGHILSILSFVTDGERTSGIHVIRNLDKLAGIALRDLSI